jgi:sodium-dependent dicarboxylate transporter 2/3/5
MPQMARTGWWLNVLFTVLITLLVLGLAPLVFDVQLGVLPDWAIKK